MTKLKDLIDIFLQPGEYVVADSNFQVRTMLGSCVSFTLWHPRTRIGAMSHFLLPGRMKESEAGYLLDARYGDEAMMLIASELGHLGICPSQCQGKIFGGGNMFPRHARSDTQNIGRKNGDVARQLFAQYGVSVVSESLFGVGHRQVIFDVSTGDVWAHQVWPTERDALPATEVQPRFLS